MGTLTARADEVIAVIYKGLAPEQRNASVEGYNNQQAQWFNTTASYAALLQFYFGVRLADEFTALQDASEQLDIQLSGFTLRLEQLAEPGHAISQEDVVEASQAALQASQAVKRQLRNLNTLALQQLESANK